MSRKCYGGFRERPRYVFFFLNGMTRETAGANSYFSYACCEESREVVIHLTENHEDETAENGPSNIYRRGILAINPHLRRV